jgi:hypothetical protein
MTTVRMLILAKMERARLKEIPARSKSGEERTHAPANGTQGSHDRRRGISAIASRSGLGRKVGALAEAEADIDVGHHAATAPSASMASNRLTGP